MVAKIEFTCYTIHYFHVKGVVMSVAFDKCASYYNRFMEYYSLYKEREIGDLLSGSFIHSLLDLGAGTCHYANYFARTIPYVVAFDESEEMLAYGHSSVNVQLGSLTDPLPFPDNSYEVVLLSDVIHHIPQQHHVALLQEIYRVVAPGGRLVLYDFHRKSAKTRFLHLFEFLLFRQRLHYYTCNEMEALLSIQFTITRSIKDGHTYLILCSKKEM